MNALTLFDLAGHVALVTGASSGIGRAIALALASAGARIVLVARRAAELAAVHEQVETAGGAATALVCDLADRSALDACARAAPDAFGAPDILVGLFGVHAEFNVNLYGLIKLRGGAFLDQRRGFVHGVELIDDDIFFRGD